MYQGPTHKNIRVLLAPNSMKGSLNAFRFAKIMADAFHAVSDRFEVVQMPIADGGDFTAEVLIQSLGLKHQEVQVRDPLRRIIKTTYGFGDNIAVIEMADASGMKLLSAEELNPLKTSSAGTGEMIRDAADKGARAILLGVGGSATIDGGMGLLEGLGLVFYDEKGNPLTATGSSLGLVDSWDDSALSVFKGVDFMVICDVDNPLLGDSGAVSTFGRQKGATEEMMPVLEQNLSHFSTLILQKKGLALNLLKGMGAAGGINLALAGFLNAQIFSGADFVLDTIGFNEALKTVDLVITGEGKIDEQTANNKAPFAVAQRAKQKDIPVVAIGGSITHEGASLFDRTYSLVNDQVGVQEAINNVEALVFERAKQAAEYFLFDLPR